MACPLLSSTLASHTSSLGSQTCKTLDMTPDDVFLATLEDLRLRCRLDASEYDMIQAAGLLRRLLLDSVPLWTRVNREVKLKLTAEWSRGRVAHHSVSGDGAWIPGLWLDPVLHDLWARDLDIPGVPVSAADFRESGNLQAFLQHETVLGEDGTVSIQELITHYANREGGVHYDEGAAKNPLIEDIRQAADEPLRHTLLAASRIVVRAFEPLAAAVHLKNRHWPAGLILSAEL